ncbi:AAA family ATPase [Thiorhodospira sibirica]|uniref:AAA family ATPase n=1 Tax=Thiorhodospira sibirica TaxID=154347 RepID=UPI00022C52AA|nr:MoxR family ATPase [Thiorhodospira sibirica]
MTDHTAIQDVLAQLNQIILGKARPIRLALSCLLARGHLLVEDQPGVGKTTLAHALARTLGLNFQRIQFTSDLLPADILGVSVYVANTQRFEFHPGPIFSQVILADEINRATPKAQSALLEAMEEQQVTSEGVTRSLPEPFFVIATQNPQEQIGAYPLPESQLDRFLMRIHLGYPDAHAERALLQGRSRRMMMAELKPCLSVEALLRVQEEVTQLHVSAALLDYVQAVLAHSREPGRYRSGLSPRAGLALLRAAQAWAFIDQRDHVIPEDVQAVLPAVGGHRLYLLESSGQDSTHTMQQLLEQVPIP